MKQRREFPSLGNLTLFDALEKLVKAGHLTPTLPPKPLPINPIASTKATGVNILDSQVW